MSKLDGLLKHFFSSNWANVFPSGDHLEKLTYITHFTLSRHSDHGRELCLELIQDSSLLALQESGNIGSVLATERTAIAINAVLLSFSQYRERDPYPFLALQQQFFYRAIERWLPHIIQLHSILILETWNARVWAWSKFATREDMEKRDPIFECLTCNDLCKGWCMLSLSGVVFYTYLHTLNVLNIYLVRSSFLTPQAAAQAQA